MPWASFTTSVNELQIETGLSFFTAISPNLATVLRSKVDGQTPPAPAISGFSPTSGTEGATVTITGTNLEFTTNVTFNGTSASFSIDSASQITATVPPGAASGPLSVAALSATVTSSDSFIIGGSDAPDLVIAAGHTGSFTQGDSGDIYTIVVANAGAVASTGTVTVVDSLPAGLTATAVSGDGWGVDLGTLTCSRSDALAAGATYPPISVTVNVSAGCPLSVTNTATVSGGADTNTANNVASDPTTINPAAAPAAVTETASDVSESAATLNATVNPNGQPASVEFQYGTNTSYGSVASVSGALTGTTPQAVSASLTSLVLGVTYHFRVSATNVLGASTGLDQTFTTSSGGGITLTTLAGWDVSELPGGAGDYGPSPLPPTTNAADVTIVGLTRGAGVGTEGTAAARAWGGNNWTNTSASAAITNDHFVTFSLEANSGYKVSYASLSTFDYRHSGTGPVDGLLQYQVGAAPFVDICPLSYPSGASTGGSLAPRDLSGIPELQNVAAGTNVTFRIVNWGATSAGGTWYVFDVAGSPAPDLAVQGTVSPAEVLLSPIEAWRLQWFGTTNNGGAGRRLCHWHQRRYAEPAEVRSRLESACAGQQSRRRRSQHRLPSPHLA